MLLKAGGTHITSCLWFCKQQHHMNIHTIFDTCPVWPEKYWTEESTETKLQTAKRSKPEKEHLMNSMRSKRTEHHINLWCCELFVETIRYLKKKPLCLVEGCAIFHHQTEQVFPASLQELYSLCPIQSTQRSFVSLGTGIAAVHDVKQPVNHLKKKHKALLTDISPITVVSYHGNQIIIFYLVHSSAWISLYR